MSWKSLVCAGLLCALAMPAMADPGLRVIDSGLNTSGNRVWTVSVKPDQSLFTTTDLGTGGSVALELGFESGLTTLVDDGVNESNVANGSNAPNDTWYYADVDGSGSSQAIIEEEDYGRTPFVGGGTTSTSDGLEFTSTNQLFAALGSTFFTSAIIDTLDGTANDGYVPVLHIVTSGPFGWLDVSGAYDPDYPNTLDPLVPGYGLIAQASQDFPDFSSTAYIIGDTPGPGGTPDGDVDLDDLLNVKNYFGVNNYGDADHDGDTDLDDLIAVKNFFTGSAPGAGAGAVAAVPEPTTVLLLVLGLVGVGFSRFRR
jgi:hypothetical protein